MKRIGGVCDIYNMLAPVTGYDRVRPVTYVVDSNDTRLTQINKVACAIDDGNRYRSRRGIGCNDAQGGQHRHNSHDYPSDRRLHDDSWTASI